MKQSIIILLALMTFTFAQNDVDSGFAVVELFTSQGCSSCPPADRLLQRIAEDAEESGEAVFALSFHVDYWNYLGWKDPFSQAQFSDRQRRYARLLRDNRVYTPQMIVNGTRAFVGHHESHATRAINEELRTPPLLHLEPDYIVTDSTIVIRCDSLGSWPEYKLSAAITAEQTPINVRRGENAGRTLAHTGIVTQFSSVSINSSQSVTLTMPLEPASPLTRAVVVFLQNEQTGKIVAASRYSF